MYRGRGGNDYIGRFGAGRDFSRSVADGGVRGVVVGGSGRARRQHETSGALWESSRKREPHTSGTRARLSH